MPQSGQELILSGRGRLEATGVQQVVSFDDQEIIVETGIGPLVLRGEGMHITHLDLTAGDLIVEGSITSLEYSEQRGKKMKARGKNILERLLK